MKKTRKEQKENIERRLNKDTFEFNGILYKKSNYTIHEYNGTKYILPNKVKHKTASKKKIKKNKKANPIIYIIRCWNKYEEFIKVGYTIQKVTNRFRKLPYKYKIIDTIEINKIGLFEYEQAIHEILEQFKYYPKIKFSGYTECYTVDVMNELRKLI